jgi:tight adherence protein C
MYDSASVLALAVFVLALICATAVYAAAFGGVRLRRDRLVGAIAVPTVASPPRLRDRLIETSLAGRLIDEMTRRSRDALRAKSAHRKLGAMVDHAGFHGARALTIFRLIQLLATGAAAVTGAIISFAFGNVTLLVGGGVVLGYVAPRYILSKLGRTRKIRLGRELPAILDLLVVCLEAGLALTESLRTVGRESDRHGGVLGGELATTAAEVSAGIPLPDSLRNLADRTGHEELKSLTAILIQSDQMGTRLGPALRASAEQLATRRRMLAEEKAQKSAIKMLVPLVLFILPAMMAVVLGPAIIQISAVFK